MEWATEDSIRAILANPEGLSDLDIERLKAASNDELASMAFSPSCLV